MKKKVVLILTLLLFTTLFTACGDKTKNDANPTTAPTVSPTTAPTTAPEATTTPEATTAAEATPPQTTPPETTPDVVTTASIVNTEEAFEAAIGSNGTWLIATLEDLEFDKDLLLEGEYKNGKKDDDGKDIIQRKIALYTQDENRTVTNRFTLTAPKLTISSPKASIQHGTFKGDLFVTVSDFMLVDATVEGNLYFTSEEAKSTFTMDKDSKVTGKQELQK